jgi:hypothetical protein
MFHVIPISNDAVLHRLSDLQEVSKFRSLVSHPVTLTFKAALLFKARETHMMSEMRTPLGKELPRSSARRMGLPTTAGKEN